MLDSLAGVYRQAGHFDEAERLYRRALPILEGSLGADHPDVAGLYHDLAALEHARGRHAAMPPRSRWPGARSRSASVRSGPGTPTSPPTGRPWPAASWAPSARTTRPRPASRRALAVLERAVEPTHPALLACLENCRDVLRAMGAGGAPCRSPNGGERDLGGAD